MYHVLLKRRKTYYRLLHIKLSKTSTLWGTLSLQITHGWNIAKDRDMNTLVVLLFKSTFFSSQDIRVQSFPRPHLYKSTSRNSDFFWNRRHLGSLDDSSWISYKGNCFRLVISVSLLVVLSKQSKRCPELQQTCLSGHSKIELRYCPIHLFSDT